MLEISSIPEYLGCGGSADAKQFEIATDEVPHATR